MTHTLEDYLSGSTEPWTAVVVGALAQAIGATRVLEKGTFLAKTAEVLSEMLPNAMIHTVEMGEERFPALEDMPEHKNVVCYYNDALILMRAWQEKNEDPHRDNVPPFDLIFLDDDHTLEHVKAEVEVAITLLRPGGILCLHDVDGPFGLDEALPDGGLAIKLPKIHIAGGLGIWQKP